MTTHEAFTLSRRSVALLISTILWMGLIFYFSARPARESASASGWALYMARSLLDWCFRGNVPAFFSDYLFAGDLFIRKSVHVLVYLVLGILVSGLNKSLGVRRVFLLSAAVCFLYAASDEFHQMFVDGRGPMVTDVLLDTAASCIGAVRLPRRMPPPH